MDKVKKYFWQWPLFFCGIILLITAVASGYWYTYDNDEFSHIQKAFLISRGYQPYTSFFSPYTPFFHYLFLPIFPIVGYTMSALYSARIVMIILFLVRLFLFAILTRIIFNRRVAILALILLLLDPFTVFASMHVRPDNLMVLLSIGAILILAIGFIRRKPSTLFWAGALMGFSAVTLIKIVPTVLVGTITFAWIAWHRNFRRGLISYLGGITAVVVLFLALFTVKGTLPDMMQQVFVDARTLNSSLLYPVRLGNFYWAPNIYVFGLPGRPLVWVFAWILPILAFVGCSFVLTGRVRSRMTDDQMDLAKILGSMLIAQWLSLFLLNSVFIQYYLPITWLFSIFAAFAIGDSFFQNGRKLASPFALLFLTLFVAVFAYGSVRANLARSKMTLKSQGLEKQFVDTWRVIPEDAHVFPNFLFRSGPYPFVYGSFYGDISLSIRSRYPAFERVLRQERVPYVIASESLLSYFSPETQKFIKEMYERSGVVPELWIRKENKL